MVAKATDWRVELQFELPTTSRRTTGDDLFSSSGSSQQISVLIAPLKIGSAWLSPFLWLRMAVGNLHLSYPLCFLHGWRVGVPEKTEDGFNPSSSFLPLHSCVHVFCSDVGWCGVVWCREKGKETIRLFFPRGPVGQIDIIYWPELVKANNCLYALVAWVCCLLAAFPTCSCS